MDNLTWMLLLICLQLILLTDITKCSFQKRQLKILFDNADRARSAHLVSEIAFKMASANDVVFHFADSTAPFVDAVCAQIGLKSTNQKNNWKKTNNFQYKTGNVVYILNRVKRDDFNISLTSYGNQRNNFHIVVLRDPLRFEKALGENLPKENMIMYICVKIDENYKSCIDDKTFKIGGEFSLSTSIFVKNPSFLNHITLIMVLEITQDLVRVYEICAFCGKYSQTLRLRSEESLNSSEIEITNKVIESVANVVDQNFKDFSGHIFKVDFPFGNIYMECERGEVNTNISGDVYTECSEWRGIEAKILVEMSKGLNFNVSFVNPKRTTNGGEWKNMLNNVLNKKVDFAIGSILFSLGRSKLYDFSGGVGIDPLRVVYMSRPNIFSEVSTMVMVFTLNTWMALLFSVSVISLLMYMSDKYLYTNSFAAAKYFWMVNSILIEQGIQNLMNIPGRRFVGSWLLCTIIICTVYKAKLTSDLIQPQKDHLATLSDLAKTGYDAHYYEVDGSLIAEIFLASSDPELQKLSSRLHNDLGICDVLKKSLQENVFLVEESVLIQQSLGNCPDTLNADERARIRVTSDNMLLSSHAWVFSKNTPYIDSFNSYIGLIYQNGLHKKWSEYLEGDPRHKNVDFQKGIVKMDGTKLMKLYGPLLMLAYGIIASSICFLGEIFFNYFKNRRRRVKTPF